MTIVVGTDFSEHSAQALTAAAHLAARTKAPLLMVHAVELGETANDPTQDLYLEALSRRLDAHADRLRSICPNVSVRLERGSPDDVLLDAVSRADAKLVVVAAHGQRRASSATLGSHADRLAQRSSVPVLVVRDCAGFEAWARGSRPLRVVIGADHTAGSKAAVQWVQALQALGPCEVILAHLYWPPVEFERLGLSGVRSYLDPDPEVQRTLEQELRKYLLPAGGAAAVKVRLHPHLGRIGDRVANIALEEKADLVAVGSHMHVGGSRLLQEAVSHHVLRTAQTSVVCVPSQAATATVAAPKLQSVLAATDLSDTGNAAVGLAFAAASTGAVVHIVHVLKHPGQFPTEPHDIFAATDGDASREALVKQLQALAPAATEGKTVRVHLLESSHAAQAIVQAAERLDANLVCLGTHGRTGLSRALLGSVAQEVLAHTRRPVLLARKPPE